MISLTSPVETWLHRWPAGLKLAALCAATIVLFYIQSLPEHIAVFAAVIIIYAIPGWEFLLSGLRQLRVLWPFVAIVLIWHLWIGSAGQGAVISLRMMSAVALANLVTVTTRLSDMINVVRVLCTPLRRLGVNTRSLEIAIALVIRLTPVLLDKAGLLRQSWRARSRRRANWRIVLPFTLLALDDADHIADALKARGGIIPAKDT